MATPWMQKIRRALSDPAIRPSALNLAVALAYATLGLLAALAATIAGGNGGILGDSVGAWALFAFLFALIYLGSSYTYHWHAKYTFERASRSFVFGTLGGAVGLVGLVVLPLYPAGGLAISVLGVGSNVLGGSWGTFVYTYRKYAHS